jgi:hypothetical protein
MPMTGSVRPDSGSIRRWRRWSAEEKLSLVARQEGIAPN